MKPHGLTLGLLIEPVGRIASLNRIDDHGGQDMAGLHESENAQEAARWSPLDDDATETPDDALSGPQIK